MSSAMPLVIGRLSWLPKTLRRRVTQNPATATTNTMTSAIHTFFTALATGVFATQLPSASPAPNRPFDRFSHCSTSARENPLAHEYTGCFGALSTLAASVRGRASSPGSAPEPARNPSPTSTRSPPIRAHQSPLRSLRFGDEADARCREHSGKGGCEIDVPLGRQGLGLLGIGVGEPLRRVGDVPESGRQRVSGDQDVEGAGPAERRQRALD